MGSRHQLVWALLIASCALGGVAFGDTIETRDGQRLQGTVVSETEAHLTIRGSYGVLTIDKRDVVRRERETEELELADGSLVSGQVLRRDEAEVILDTGYGVLVIPTGDVRAGDGRSAAGPVAVDPRRLQELHRVAIQRLQAGDTRSAIAAYGELLELAPEDDTALYNTACAYALRGSRHEALVFLERAVAAGFTNFEHVRSDSDLDSLRAEPRYLQLMAREAELVRAAAAQATDRLLREMRTRGVKGDYQVFVDEAQSFVYLHTLSPERLAAARREIDEYSRLQWRDLFRNRVRQPLQIVLLTREDGPAMLDNGVGGFFNPGTNVLVCGDILSMKLNRTSVVVHELTHALHFADQSARRQPHPIWLVEGLGALFESSRVVDDRLLPIHSARLTAVQQALARGRTIPWRTIMEMDQPRFMEVAGLAYAQARYMLFYMWEKGFLKRFYDEYTTTAAFQSDRSALEAFEVVFGRPIDEVERDWKQWIQTRQAPSVPFIGISTQATPEGCRIVNVVAGSGAAAVGLRVGDVLVSADGSPLRTPEDVLEVLSTRDVGDELELELLRERAHERVRVTLGERP